jgi:WD40 repeat protein
MSNVGGTPTPHSNARSRDIGKVLASGSDDDDPDSIKLWDPKSGRLIHHWNGGPGTTASLAFSPGGSILASAHLADRDNVRPWDAETDEHLASISSHTARACIVALHRHGDLLASAGSDKAISLWEVETRRCLRVLDAHENTIHHLVFAPGNERVKLVLPHF